MSNTNRQSISKFSRLFAHLHQHVPGLTDSVRYVVVAEGDNRDDMVELVAKMSGLVPLPVPVPLSVGGGLDELLAMPRA